MIVDRYGIHWQDDIAYLHQGSGNVTALGAKNKSPFKVRCYVPCRSKIDPSKANKLVVDPNDPFVNAMDPVPQQDEAYYLVDKQHLDQVRHLAWMCGTNTSGLEFPRQVFKSPAGNQMLMREAASTNVQPLIISGVRVSDIGFVYRVTQGIWPRKLIFLVDPDVFVRGIPKVVPAMDYRVFSQKEWTAHGNWLIREYMLNGTGPS